MPVQRPFAVVVLNDDGISLRTAVPGALLVEIAVGFVNNGTGCCGYNFNIVVCHFCPGKRPYRNVCSQMPVITPASAVVILDDGS
ncbi:MAG: hypothetical protein ACOYPR_13115 [Saprospiraceae bacterium]